MKTALDSSILIDILKKDSRHYEASFRAVQDLKRKGPLVVCPVVWAEVSCFYTDKVLMNELFSQAGILFDAFDQETSELAGDIWKNYRRTGGSREHLIPDFLVAAHAQTRADCLLTRDRGFFRKYFKRLKVVEPK